MSVNKAILIGNVGKDPEVQHLEGGTTVAKFTLATSESYKNKSGETVTNTEWHNIVVWRQLAELVEKWVVKGKELYIEGKITNRSYDDKDGNKRFISEIVADSIRFIGKKDGQNSNEKGLNRGISDIDRSRADEEHPENTSNLPF